MIENELVELLKEKKLKVSTVESCTGGMIASRIVNVAGASDVLEAGFVTYSGSAKEALAGVNKKTLEKYTAVSEETAYEMVTGEKPGPKADVYIAVTGYAGPTSYEGAPAGLVYIAVNVCGDVKVIRCLFEGDRQAVRESAAEKALTLAVECLRNI